MAYQSIYTGAEIDRRLTAVDGKIPFPSPAYAGLFPMATAQGGIQWVPRGQPTDAQTAAAISAWLAAHPEATTTVQDGSLTLEKFSAALKAAVGGANNPNLLDNPWFTVNQRGANSAVSGAYGVDRWKGVGNGYQVIANGIVVSGAAVQVFDSPGIDGKTVTFSVLLSDGTLETGTTTYSGNTKTVLSGTRVRAILYPSANQINISPGASGAAPEIRAVKLELGSISTLASDFPPNYAAELAKCQRYFVRMPISTNRVFAMGYFVNATTLRFMIKLPTVMRANPTVSYQNIVIRFATHGTYSSISSFTCDGIYLNTLSCSAPVTGATAYETAILVGDGTHHIDFSADL